MLLIVDILHHLYIYTHVYIDIYIYYTTRIPILLVQKAYGNVVGKFVLGCSDCLRLGDCGPRTGDFARCSSLGNAGVTLTVQSASKMKS